MYGATEYSNDGENEREKEFNFSAEKEIVKNTTLNLTYADINADNSDNNNNYYNIQLKYSF